MRIRLKERTNEQWLVELRGAGRDAALADLRVVLFRGLKAALRGRAGADAPFVEDCVQETLIKVIAGLDSFRGESRFTVWAQKIAVRVAFAEMRRHRWRDVSLEEAIARPQGGIGASADPEDDPERAATRAEVVSEFRRLLDEELTERQRTALLAALGGMPLEAIADRMGTNRNALYKTLHDARKRLKRGMTTGRFSPQDMLAAFEG